jgi:predicted nucleotidyltransferase
MVDVHTLEEEMGAALVQQRLIALLSTLFGGLALLLASVGLYGLLAFALVQRTGEMGIRMALGAKRGDVVWMVIGEAWVLVAIGIAVGYRPPCWWRAWQRAGSKGCCFDCRRPIPRPRPLPPPCSRSWPRVRPTCRTPRVARGPDSGAAGRVAASDVGYGTAMPPVTPASIDDLPDRVSRELGEFVDQATRTLGDTLRAIVLFGSAAENRLRTTSDVNVVVVLTAFDGARIAALRPTLLQAHAAIRLDAMWLLESEIEEAARAFAVKFTDIARRRRVLVGTDPFATLTVSRQAAIARLHQVLLNQILRLRASFAADGGQEERLAHRIADAAGPLRVSAAEILVLEGGPALQPREALDRVAADWPDARRDGVLQTIREARESGLLERGRAAEVLLAVIDLACYLHARVESLS